MKLVTYFLCCTTLMFSLFSVAQAQQGFVRAVPNGSAHSAAYLTLNNYSDNTLALVKVSTPVAKEVQLHTVIKEQGVVKMRQQKEFIIPAQGQLVLKQKSDHLMLIGLKENLQVGEKIPFTLHFSNGSTQEVYLPVKEMHKMSHH